MFYEFKATYWDEFNERDEEDCGLVFAENYSTAAGKIKADYGKELISMYLCELDAANTITIDEIKKEFKLYS